jgi:uncharacterized protein
MDRIYIPQLLKAPQKTARLELKGFVSGLESLNPVSGEMKVYRERSKVVFLNNF